ncbi:hypothetical protein BD310DRAFT_819387 [Dichomitus squalens]|uniref:Sld7 C-terminal domain-containing protein n=1 Tax=Dichomitus squalens TaxID=114155 RepID=A0A4Q9PV80_9APHY|nr:hypothetical protein BD310DRAFT_819387 [Dichomitus squalens]
MVRIPRPHLLQKVASGSAVAAALGKDARVGAGRDKDVFKVPSVPIRRTASEADVFGSPSVSAGSGSKGKEREKEKVESVERENRNMVKRAITKALAREGVGKGHAEFKELFQMVYHGACFALRRRLGIGALDAQTIEHFVDAHIRMYVNDVPS